MSRLLKFARLPADEKFLLLKAWCLLAAATTRLRLLPHSRNRVWIEGFDHEGTPASDDAAHCVAWAVAVASQYVPGCRCLPQAIAARGLLHSMGYRSTVRIGVRKPTESQLEAHAWLECDGRILVGAPSESATLAPWAVLR